MFDYEVVASSDTPIPFPPIVYIVPKHYSPDETGWPRLSPQLMSEGEIDEFIKSCKQDLDRAGRLANAALKRARRS